MSDSAQNGFSPEAPLHLPDRHEELRQLCALLTTGELTDAERRRLDEHVAQCASCAVLLKEYEELAGFALPGLAAELHEGPGRQEIDPNSNNTWSIEAAEQRLIDSLREKTSPKKGKTTTTTRSVGWSALKLAVAASLLAASCLGFYYLGRVGNRVSNEVASPAKPSQKAVAPEIRTPVLPSIPDSTGASEEKRIADLRQSIAQGEREREDLKRQLSLLTQDLNQSSSELTKSQNEQSELAKELNEAKESSKAGESQTTNQGGQGSDEIPVLRARIGDLNGALDAKDKEIAQDQELLAHDRDIRNLIGARDLYIAEIYDVNKAGDTQKPFGRIFYTKDRSLVFYGYDLDQQRGMRKNASFQVWGRRGTDRGQDINLGLLYLDDADKRRWVLKFNDPKTIAQLNAVFITVEPQGGSTKPTGKPLLFTYLRLDPNHP